MCPEWKGSIGLSCYILQCIKRITGANLMLCSLKKYAANLS